MLKRRSPEMACEVVTEACLGEVAWVDKAWEDLLVHHMAMIVVALEDVATLKVAAGLIIDKICVAHPIVVECPKDVADMTCFPSFNVYKKKIRPDFRF